MGRQANRPTGRLLAIRQLLDHDDVCREIVRYLVAHSEAADTIRGIAEWWIKRDIARTAQALTKLQQHGIVHSYLVQDATSVYAFTKNPFLRATLRQYIDLMASPTAAERR